MSSSSSSSYAAAATTTVKYSYKRSLSCTILTMQPTSAQIYGAIAGLAISITVSFIMKNAGVNDDLNVNN